MARVDEAVGARTPMGADLAQGVNTVSYDQKVVFTRYVRLVLPLDGSVFWVKASLVSESALYNALKLNKVPFNKAGIVTTAARTINAQGSLHYATTLNQGQTEASSENQVVFTSLQEIRELNEIGPNELFIGEFEDLRFAFSSRQSFYRQANLWHYVGASLYSDMSTQVIDDAQSINRAQIVSNSLPIWLSLNNYSPFYGFGNDMPLYPSFLLPNNIKPPFASVHIVPESTQAMASTATLGRTLTHDQLTQEDVQIVLYGMRNAEAMSFIDCINQFSLDSDVLGIMNIPTMRDDKRAQVQFGTIAQRKTVNYTVNYYQNQARNIARQLIVNAIPTFIPGE